MAWLGKIGVLFRRHTSLVAGAGVITVLGAGICSQTLGLQYYKRLMAHYRNGAVSLVDSETQQLIDKVIHRINLSIEDEGRLNFFVSFPPDPVRRGSLQLRFGVLIGLPSNFSYQTVDDVEHNSILVGQEKVDWNSFAGEELQNALVLSDKAKAFVIAREIYRAKTFSLHLETLLQAVSLFMAYVSGSALNQRFLLTMRLKMWARFLVFSMIGVGWLGLYITISDSTQCWRDNKVDKAAAKLRKIYAEGGVEYYDAVLRRNCALRTLLGLRGTKQFTRYGNAVSLWRNRTVQLTSRRDNLQKYLAEYEQAEAVEQPDGFKDEAKMEA